MAWSDAAREAAKQARRRKYTQRVEVGQGMSVTRKEFSQHLRTARKRGDLKAFNPAARNNATRMHAVSMSKASIHKRQAKTGFYKHRKTIPGVG